MSGDKVVVYTLPGRWGVSSSSPFCVKLETWLRIAEVPYEVVCRMPAPKRAPKGKFPFADIGGRTISDSRLIVAHLCAQRGIDLESGLSARDRAVGHAVGRMLEEGTYFVLLHDRWADDDGWAVVKDAYFGALPPVVRHLVPAWLRRGTRGYLHGQGTGRLTPDEIAAIGLRDIEALIDLLGDRPYLLGDLPRSVDATAYAFLAAYLWAPVPSPLRDRVSEAPALGAYCERMRARYWPEHVPQALIAAQGA